jgi:enoyl-CoA hydratase/carnithine racemase
MMESFRLALNRQPPSVDNVLVSFPKPHVLLITLNRPEKLNAIPPAQQYQLEELFNWFDNEKALRCAVVTGTGRAFCAGADLKAWHDQNAPGNEKNIASSLPPTVEADRAFPISGFGGMSNRPGKKPVIAAVNGLCLGGGMEMVINADLIIAAETAKFGLPEVTKGVVAIAGALPRLIKSVGRQRASEMALVGRMYTAKEMEKWGLVNQIVSPADVVPVSIDIAEKIASNSPDAVIVSRHGLRIGWDAVSPDAGTEELMKGLYKEIEGGENMKEGVRSFVEKRKPVWRDSKL